MNKLALEKQLNDWVDTEKSKHAPAEETISHIWSNLADCDSANKQEHVLLKSVEEMIDDMFSLHLPHKESWDALEDLRNNFPKVDIQLFACYWKAKAKVAINVGKSKEEVFEIIESGRAQNAQPNDVLETFAAEVAGRYAQEPHLAEGKAEEDPEMTMLPEDDELELSIVFSPPFTMEALPTGSQLVKPKLVDQKAAQLPEAAGDHTGPLTPAMGEIDTLDSISILSPMIDQYTKTGNNASFFRLMVSSCLFVP